MVALPDVNRYYTQTFNQQKAGTEENAMNTLETDYDEFNKKKIIVILNLKLNGEKFNNNKIKIGDWICLIEHI